MFIYNYNYTWGWTTFIYLFITICVEVNDTTDLVKATWLFDGIKIFLHAISVTILGIYIYNYIYFSYPTIVNYCAITRIVRFFSATTRLPFLTQPHLYILGVEWPNDLVKQPHFYIDMSICVCVCRGWTTRQFFVFELVFSLTTRLSFLTQLLRNNPTTVSNSHSTFSSSTTFKYIYINVYILGGWTT